MRINKALKVLMSFNGLFLFGVMLFGSLNAIYVQRIGGVVLVGVSSAVFCISASLFLWVVSRFGDRVKEKELLLALSYLLRSIGYLGFIWVNSALSLVIWQMIFGLAEALGTPTFSLLFAKHVDGDKEMMEYSDWSLVANIIMGIGSLIGGYFVSSFGFNPLFVIVSGFCFISGIGVLLMPRKLL